MTAKTRSGLGLEWSLIPVMVSTLLGVRPTLAVAQVPALLDASADKTVARAFVPSPEQKVGEVRLIVRGNVNVVQTLLYTKVLSRVVGEIRKKESANWPADRANHADAMRYMDALEQAQKTIWGRMPKDKQVDDRRQRMIIEFALSQGSGVVMIGAYDMNESGGEVKVVRREPLVTLDLPREYVKRNMQLIVADSFDAADAKLDSLLEPLTLLR